MFDFFSAVHTIGIGILLQALPFMLLGSLLSSALHMFIPPHIVIKAFPKKSGLGFLTALFAGLLFPVCECASVPLMRALIKKGVAMPIAVTFMLAAPIINPVSIVSTLYAFPQQPMVAFYRLYFGLTIAFGIGLLLLCYPEKSYLKEELSDDGTGEPAYGSTRPAIQFNANRTVSKAEERLFLRNALPNTVAPVPESSGILSRILHTGSVLLLHTGSEFFAAGQFLIIGAFITALIRVGVPQHFFTLSAQSFSGSLLLMMLFAFVFSACSSSDAFIARSFLNRFSLGPILGFLVYGPMMDIKNLFMLLSLFKKRFVIELTLIITAAHFIGTAILVRLFIGNL